MYHQVQHNLKLGKKLINNKDVEKNIPPSMEPENIPFK